MKVLIERAVTETQACQIIDTSTPAGDGVVDFRNRFGLNFVDDAM